MVGTFLLFSFMKILLEKLKGCRSLAPPSLFQVHFHVVRDKNFPSLYLPEPKRKTVTCVI
jgi:hypothetical protein